MKKFIEIKTNIPEKVYYEALCIGLKRLIKDMKERKAMLANARRIAKARIIKRIKVKS